MGHTTATQTTQQMGHYYLIVKVTIKLMVKIDMHYGCNNP